MQKTSVKIRGYKCFAEESGFDAITRVNIIIGRNNSGKSALLDLIEVISANKYDFDRQDWRSPTPPEVIFRTTLTQEQVDATFPTHTSGGRIGQNHNAYGRTLIGRAFAWSIIGSGGRPRASLVSCDDAGITPSLKKADDYGDRLANNIATPLRGKIFKRVSAERDINPEPDSNVELSIKPNGRGITNVIQSFINKSYLPSSLVEGDMLTALNSIFSHDAFFSDIVCQQHKDSLWEIFLEEREKGRVALSRSGSGLKTVITVLANLFLVPALEGKPLSDYVFGFEELENNIHPALLRRLNYYLYQLAVERDFSYFMTTHSSVLIDQFSKQEDAQILHVTQEAGASSVSTAITYIHNNGILDDLDVKASDLLQANGLIWVEGPSDRIYLNRWIDLWSNGQLKEGTHYQILFYGGRLLSHLSAEIPDVFRESISILNANRNGILLIDSDKRSRNAGINDTKKRLRDEFARIGAMCWITKGREIENYITEPVINAHLDRSNSGAPDQFGSFFNYLDSLRDREGTKYSSRKSLLAEKLVGKMTRENMSTSLDLDGQMQLVCETIRRWNA